MDEVEAGLRIRREEYGCCKDFNEELRGDLRGNGC